MANHRTKNETAAEKSNLSVKQMPPQSAEQLEIFYTANFSLCQATLYKAVRDNLMPHRILPCLEEQATFNYWSL